MPQVLFSLIIVAICATVLAVPSLRERVPGGTVALDIATIGFLVSVLGYVWIFPTGTAHDRIVSSVPVAIMLVWRAADLLRRNASA